MINKTDDLKNTTPLTAKKQWQTPKAEVISNDAVKSGSVLGAVEGQTNHVGTVYSHHS